MEVTASARNVRISPKKVLLLVDQIKKMNPQDAVDILNFTRKASSSPLSKVIKSAMANAKNNMGADEKSLKFKTILVEKGPMSKRYRPVARGRAHAILKRTTHIIVTLSADQKKTQTKAIEQPKEKTETKKGNDGTKS